MKKEKIKNIVSRVKFFCMNLMMMIVVGYPVFAKDKKEDAQQVAEPTIVTGTRTLLAAGTGLVTGLLVAMGTFKAITVGTQWINASAEERPKYQKELITVIVATVVVLTIGSTITYIVGFYNGTAE